MLGLSLSWVSPFLQLRIREMSMFTKRLSWGIGIACALLLYSLLGMAVWQARIGVQKMQSLNNIKQIGLAFHNYESAWKRLPPGCDEEEKHGWQTHLHPYMEASSWFGQLDKQFGWEHPFNAHSFRTRMPCYLNPGVGSTYSSEGYSLTHYLANSSLFYRGSDIKFSDIDPGLSNAFFVGEIGAMYQPFGYPYNWRALTWPLNAQDGGYGAWSDGVHFGLGDASVRFVSSSIDRSVVEQLANATAKPDSERTRIPDRIFRCGGDEFGRKILFQNERSPRAKGASYSVVFLDPNRRAEVVVYRGGSGISSNAILSKYSDARILDYFGDFDSSTAERIGNFKNLEALEIREITDTEHTIAILHSLPKLNYLRGNFDADLLEQLHVALPACDVSTREHSVPN